MISVIITHVPLCCLMPHISPHEGSTEQQPGIGVKPPRSSGLYPPEPPCWQDRWLSKITKDNVSSVETRGCSKEYRADNLQVMSLDYETHIDNQNKHQDKKRTSTST